MDWGLEGRSAGVTFQLRPVGEEVNQAQERLRRKSLYLETISCLT